jgi:hypothetical protein
VLGSMLTWNALKAAGIEPNAAKGAISSPVPGHPPRLS